MKHINKLFLLLAALMLLGGCGQATAPADSPPVEAPPQVEAAPEPPAAPDPAPDLEADAPAEDLTADNTAAETPSDAAPEAALLEVPVPPAVQRIPVGEAFAADLDGDGSFETVQLTMDAAESGSAAGTLTVWYDGGESSVTCAFDAPAETYVLFDLDTTDAFLELGLQDQGLSTDPVIEVFRFVDGALQSLGSVDGSFEPGSTGDDSWRTVTCYGDGYLQSYFRFSVLQTWFARASYRVERDTLTRVPQEFYQRADEGLSLWPDAGVHLTTLMELTAYAEPDAASAALPLPAGTALDPLGSDNDGGMDYGVPSWVWFRRADTGEDVYIQLYGFSYLAPDGIVHNVTDVFEPLSLFD